MLKNEFVRVGHWLFRWRSYLPVVMIGIFLIAMLDYEYIAHSEELDHLWEGICLVVSFLGLGIRVFTIGHAPRGTSGRNTKQQVADSLNMSGAYSVVRNPLYLGNFFMGLGFALFPHLWWLVLLYVLVFCVYYERIIFAEEEYLNGKFGDQYVEWANKVPAFIPKFSNYKNPELAFSLKNVLKREYNGLFCLISVMFLLEIAGDIIYTRKFEIDLMWYVLQGFGFVAWVTLRSLKKYTVLLNVEGR